MKLHPVVAGAALVAAVTAGCGGSSSGGGDTPAGGGNGNSSSPAAVQHPKSLVGEVGKNDKFTISLTGDDGTDIENLAAGTYQLVVHDYSDIHNFHLMGAGVDQATDVGGKGDKTFTVTFKPGSYTFVCDPHTSSMKGSFTVS